MTQHVFYHADNETIHARYDSLLMEWSSSRGKTRDQISKAKSARWKIDVLKAAPVEPPPLNDDENCMSIAAVCKVNTAGKVLSALATTTPHAVWDAGVRFVQSTRKGPQGTTVFPSRRLERCPSPV